MQYLFATVRLHFAEREYYLAHMENGEPNLSKVPVNRATYHEMVGDKYVVSSGFVDEDGQPYVKVCEDRSEVNCKQCIRSKDCCAFLPEK